MSVEAIRILGSKQSFESTWITIRWSRIKYTYFFYCVISAVVLSSVIFFCVEDAELYSGFVVFFIILFILWKRMPIVSRRCARIEVRRAWEKFPNEKMYVELDERVGLKKGFLNSMSSDESNGQAILTKVETINGHTVIFCNVGKQKNQVWFVADHDFTEFLNLWLSVRGFLNHERKKRRI